MSDLSPTLLLLIALGALLVGVTVASAVYAVILTMNAAARVRLLESQVARYVQRDSQVDPHGSVAARLSEWLEKSATGRRLVSLAEDSDVGYSAGRLLLYAILLAGMLGTAAQVMNAGLLPTILLGAMGLIIPYYWLQQQADRRLERVLEQLPETLVVIANALSAGASIQQALESSVGELAQPIATEIRRIGEEMKVGRSLEEALYGFRQRVPLVELDSLIAAILIQRRSGGNLAELLDEMSSLLKEEVQLRQEMKVQTSQAKLSAIMVGLAPVGLFLVLYFFNPEYMLPMTSTAIGMAMLVGAFLLEAVGFYAVQRISVIQM